MPVLYINAFNYCNKPRSGNTIIPFLDEWTKEQRGQVTCPRPHSRDEVGKVQQLKEGKGKDVSQSEAASR